MRRLFLLSVILLAIGCAPSQSSSNYPSVSRFDGWERIAEDGQDGTSAVYLHCFHGTGLYQKHYYEGALFVISKDPECQR